MRNAGSFHARAGTEIAQVAAHAGLGIESFVKDATLRIVDETARFRVAVREGIAQANKGEFVDDEEVRFWLEQREHS